MTTSTKESSQTTPASRIQRPSTSSVALASSVSSSAVITTEQQSNANANGNQYAGPTKEEYRQGMTSIAIITILFSSNSPVIHAAFINASLPPPVLLLNAMTSTIALAGIFIGGPLLDATGEMTFTFLRVSSVYVFLCVKGVSIYTLKICGICNRYLCHMYLQFFVYLQ